MGWKERTLERSLESATERSLERAQRFVAAAREIVAESRKLDFGVQDVVRRAGLSLRAFYRHFPGKQELLLALYEEGVYEAVEGAARRLERIEDPLERLRFLVERFYAERGAFASPLSAEIQALVRARPDEIRSALEPLRALFEEVVEGAVRAGVARPGSARAHAQHLLLTVLIHTHARGQLAAPNWPSLSREELWAYCRRALCAE